MSQASIRRWSNSGLLQARRVGRRRERRFTEADLNKLLGPAATGPTPSLGPGQTEVFVGATRAPTHSHIATFYNSDEGRLRLTIPFLRDGLLNGQPCFLVAEGDVLKAYLGNLRNQEGIDVDGAIREKKLTTARLPGKTVKGALQFWERVLTGPSRPARHCFVLSVR